MNRIQRAAFGATMLSSVLAGAVLAACEFKRDEPTLPRPTSAAIASAVSTFGLSRANATERMQVAQNQLARSTGSMGGKAVSAADVDFVAAAANASTLEVEASRVALEKAKTPAVRNFAQRMVEEHSKTGAELRALSVASSVGNVAALSPKDGEQMRRLQALQGREFDREYIVQIGVAAHHGAVNAFQKAAESASDNQLKAFAQAKLPVLREHLMTAQSLAKELGPRSTKAKGDPLATGAVK